MSNHIGMWSLTVTEPPAFLEEFGTTHVVVRGFNGDEHDRRNLEFHAANEVAKLIGHESYDHMPEQFTPIGFSAPELTANKFQTAEGKQQFFVGVYRVGQGYGGPEEGGWWFSTGNLVRQVACNSWDEAEAVRARYVGTKEEPGEFAYTGLRSSVRSGEDYDVVIDIAPHPEYFPEERPRYE